MATQLSQIAQGDAFHALRDAVQRRDAASVLKQLDIIRLALDGRLHAVSAYDADDLLSVLDETWLVSANSNVRLALISLLNEYLRAGGDGREHVMQRAFALFFDRIVTALEHGFACDDYTTMTCWYTYAEGVDSFFKALGKCNFPLLLADASLRDRLFALIQAIPHIPNNAAQFYLFLAGNRLVRYVKRADPALFKQLASATNVTTDALLNMSRVADFRRYGYTELDTMQARLRRTSTKSGGGSGAASAASDAPIQPPAVSIKFPAANPTVGAVFSFPARYVLTRKDPKAPLTSAGAGAEGSLGLAFRGWCENVHISVQGLSGLMLEPSDVTAFLTPSAPTQHDGTQKRDLDKSLIADDGTALPPLPAGGVTASDVAGAITMEDVLWCRVEKMVIRTAACRIEVYCRSAAGGDTINVCCYVLASQEIVQAATAVLLRVRTPSVQIFVEAAPAQPKGKKPSARIPAADELVEQMTPANPDAIAATHALDAAAAAYQRAEQRAVDAAEAAARRSGRRAVDISSREARIAVGADAMMLSSQPVELSSSQAMAHVVAAGPPKCSSTQQLLIRAAPARADNVPEFDAMYDGDRSAGDSTKPPTAPGKSGKARELPTPPDSRGDMAPTLPIKASATTQLAATVPAAAEPAELPAPPARSTSGKKGKSETTVAESGHTQEKAPTGTQRSAKDSKAKATASQAASTAESDARELRVRSKPVNYTEIEDSEAVVEEPAAASTKEEASQPKRRGKQLAREDQDGVLTIIPPPASGSSASRFGTASVLQRMKANTPGASGKASGADDFAFDGDDGPAASKGPAPTPLPKAADALNNSTSKMNRSTDKGMVRFNDTPMGPSHSTAKPVVPAPPSAPGSSRPLGAKAPVSKLALVESTASASVSASKQGKANLLGSLSTNVTPVMPTRPSILQQMKKQNDENAPPAAAKAASGSSLKPNTLLSLSAPKPARKDESPDVFDGPPDDEDDRATVLSGKKGGKEAAKAPAAQQQPAPKASGASKSTYSATPSQTQTLAELKARQEKQQQQHQPSVSSKQKKGGVLQALRDEVMAVTNTEQHDFTTPPKTADVVTQESNFFANFSTSALLEYGAGLRRMDDEEDVGPVVTQKNKTGSAAAAAQKEAQAATTKDQKEGNATQLHKPRLRRLGGEPLTEHASFLLPSQVDMADDAAPAATSPAHKDASQKSAEEAGTYGQASAGTMGGAATAASSAGDAYGSDDLSFAMLSQSQEDGDVPDTMHEMVAVVSRMFSRAMDNGCVEMQAAKRARIDRLQAEAAEAAHSAVGPARAAADAQQAAVQAAVDRFHRKANQAITNFRLLISRADALEQAAYQAGKNAEELVERVLQQQQRSQERISSELRSTLNSSAEETLARAGRAASSAQKVTSVVRSGLDDVIRSLRMQME